MRLLQLVALTQALGVRSSLGSRWLLHRGGFVFPQPGISGSWVFRTSVQGVRNVCTGYANALSCLLGLAQRCKRKTACACRSSHRKRGVRICAREASRPGVRCWTCTCTLRHIHCRPLRIGCWHTTEYLCVGCFFRLVQKQSIAVQRY